MTIELNRRSMLGLGTVAAAGAVLGTATAASAEDETAAAPPADAAAACGRIGTTYTRETGKAGGNWYSYVTVAAADGSQQVAVEDDADTEVFAYSVNKVGVASAVMDKIDRGLLTLDQKVELTQSIIIPDGDGIYRLHGAYGDQITIGNFLSALLLVSDDTAVRLCGLVCPSAEINQFFADRGFEKTRVTPVANPNRFYLGMTTPRETHTLFTKLVNNELISAASTAFLLNILRWKDGYQDGIRRNMSTAERLRIASKYGAFDDGRNEAGVIFDAEGTPALTYAFFANGTFSGPNADPANWGATHPAVQARSVIGRVLLDSVEALPAAATLSAQPAIPYTPSDGG